MTKKKSKQVDGKPAQSMVSAPIKEPKLKPAQTAPIDMYCRCLADPEGSGPCRVPDDFMVPSVVQKCVEEYSITTNATGSFYGSVTPCPIRGVYSATTIGVGVAGVVDGTSYRSISDFASLYPTFALGRMVTYQVTVSYIGANNTCAGRVCIVSDTSFLAYGAGTKLTDMFDDGTTAPTADGVFYRGRPRQTPRMEDLNITTFGYPTFDTAFFCGVGLPVNSECISVRVTRHMELVPIKGNIWRNAAALEPYNPLVVAQSVNMAQAGTVGTAKERGAMAQVGLAAAAGAWNYLKQDVKAIAGEAGVYAAGAAKTALLALM